MPVYNKLLFSCLLLLFNLLSGTNCAQQIVPRLIRQFKARPGLNLNAGGMSLDSRGHLWIASGDGVIRFGTNQFRVYHDPVTQEGDYYYHVVPAPDGRVWLKMGRGYSLSYVDPQLDRVVRLPDSTRLVRDYLAKYGCHYLYADAQGLLWIALKKKGLLTFNPRTLAVQHVVDRSLDVRSIAQDRQGTIYLTTTNQGLFTYTPRTGQLVSYQHDDQDTTSLGNNATFSVLPRPDGTVLVGIPEDVDVFNPATGKFRHLGLNQVLSTNPQQRPHVVEFQSDQQGNTWFTTGVATYRFTRQDKLQWVLLSSLPSEVDALCPGPAAKLRVCAQGTLYEYDLTNLRVGPDLIIQRVDINGSTLTANTSAQSLVYDTNGHPTLTVQENDPFTLHYTLSASRRSNNIRQRLEGYDHDWKTGDVYGGTAIYQLPAGTYTFIVNRGKPSGGWEPAVSTMTIVVVPPAWRSGYAITLALLLVGGVGYYLIRTYYRRRQLRQQLAREQLEAANLRHLDELKTRFFGNVTHEFRTPLTLILHATEQLINRPITDWERERLGTINRNADQLARLITQMLDIAKMDAQKLDVQLKLGDPLLFIEQCVAGFTDLASQRRINLMFALLSSADEEASVELRHLDPPERICPFDDDKLGKIIYNLLSNALKFTPEGGTVRVSSGLSDDRQLLVRVQDTGIGIAADQLAHVFDRFYQADASTTRRYEGTGIGLAYVRELTELLGGRVTVESALGVGSSFTVTLPLQVSATSMALIPTDPVPMAGPLLDGQPMNSPVEAGESSPTIATDKPLVLIVEDNQELRSYMAGQLRRDYHVLEAVDGRDGIDQALAAIPDLVVSDVMMPYVDGYTLVETLKQDKRTSHIPILMLTAKSSFDSRMQGLNAGADDYLSKPFNIQELQLRVRNQLESRQRQRDWVRASLTQPDPAPAQSAPIDPFLKQLYALIETHLDDTTFGVEQLTTNLGLSRTSLFRKVKSLTDLSANELIRNYRLKRATQLLREGHAITQTAYEVGFESPSYFSKCFRDLYQLTPREFVAQA